MQSTPAIARLLARNDSSDARNSSRLTKRSISPEARNPIEGRGGRWPILDQNRLDTCGPEQREKSSDFGSESWLGVMQAEKPGASLRGRRVAQLSGSNAPPSQSSRAES